MHLLVPPARRSTRLASRRVVLTAGAALLACVVGCGPATPARSPATAAASASASSPSPAATATPAVGCPSAATVGTALGLAPAAPAATAMPEGVLCIYEWSTSAVLITLIPGVSTTIFTTAEKAVETFQKQLTGVSSIAFTPVSGVGDEGYSYSYLDAGATDDGILAVKGTDYAGVSCTGTTVTLSRIEAFVNQILEG